MAENTETIKGTSLWKDAWKRLLKNKLAVFGLIVMVIMIIAVSIGPAIIRWTTGFTADFIPPQGDLIKSFPPSLQHPMGTDEAGRDLLARVLQGGRISLMVGVISTIVSLLVGVSYGAIAGYMGGKIDNLMMRIVDIIYAIPYILIVIVLLSVFGGPNTPSWIQWMSEKFGGAGNQGLSQIFLLFFALGLVSWLTMARVVRGQILSLKNQEFVVAARATGVSTPGYYLSSSCSQRARSRNCLCDADRSFRNADRSLSFIFRFGCAGTLRFVGKFSFRRHKKHRAVSVAIDFSGRDDGVDPIFLKLFRRRVARRA